MIILATINLYICLISWGYEARYPAILYSLVIDREDAQPFSYRMVSALTRKRMAYS